jgi:hypothetical protein
VDGRLDHCFDVYVDDQGYQPEEMPRSVDLAAASHEELAMAWRKNWQPGQLLRIRFLDGDAALRARVEGISRQWLGFANLAFTFGNHADAEVRISFAGDGYWSMIGTDALRVTDPRRPTMQLGGFHADADEVELRRTVLHEFGHALGCVHEQASPAASIPWDAEKVYEFYHRWHGWGRAQTLQNVLHRYNVQEVYFTHHDPTSIMQYPVRSELTTGDFEIGWNTELSLGDKSFIARMYPASGRK